jgi:hypothetical protein
MAKRDYTGAQATGQSENASERKTAKTIVRKDSRFGESSELR